MSADILYSSTLLAAIILASLSLLLAILWAWWPGAPMHTGHILAHQFGKAALWLAGGCLLVSIGVHYLFGHGPGSAEEMRLLEFVREHIAFLITAVLIGLVYLGRRRITRASIDEHMMSNDLS